MGGTFYLSTMAAMAPFSVPRMSLHDSFEEGRFAGTGGGGQSLYGGTTPFFCKCCGKTVGRKKVKPSCDVCSKCRSRGGRSR